MDDLVIAAALCVVGSKSLVRGDLRAKQWARLALASILFLGVPVLVVQTAQNDVYQATISALFALVPIVIVVIASSLDSGGAGSSGSHRLLAPTLIGFGGILLLLPVAEPNSWRQAGFEGIVVLSVLILAVASVWMYRLLRDFTVMEAAVVCCVANGLFFTAVFLYASARSGAEMPFSGGSGSWHAFAIEAAIAIFFDLPQVLLLLWLMREVAPERFAARYLVMPLLTVVEGYAVMRPEITLRLMGGATLVIFGAWRLMTASGRDEEPGLVLR